MALDGVNGFGAALCAGEDEGTLERGKQHRRLLGRSPGHSTAAVARTTQAKPTVVLVNGAWANNASWSRVIKRLQNDGYTVVAPPNPLQSLNGDAETIADLLQTIPARSSLSATPTAAW